MAESLVYPDLQFGRLKSARPSTETEDYWIYAENRSSENNQKPNENCGKWMLFEDIAVIDDIWDRIKQATVMGRLGFASKVSTMKDKEGRSSNPTSQFVICIYTYDWTNESDVYRVRQELRTMGWERKLPYKSDGDTIAGNYASKGKRVSKYYY